MKRILVIDDEPGITQLLEQLLVEEGYEVLTAADGAEGLSYVRGGQIDIVLLDLMMPNMSGWSFLDAIEQLPIAQRPKVAILSAVFGDEAIRKARDRYAAGAYITKPFRIQELLDTVQGMAAA